MPKTLADKFREWLKRQPDNPEADALANFLDDDTETPKEPIVADFTSTPEYKKLMAKIEAQDKALAAQDKALATFTASQSTHAADKALAKLAHKITPAQKPALLALFMQAAQDDADATTVTFSVEGQEKPFEGSRVDALLAVFSTLGDIKLTEELLDDSQHATFGADSAGTMPGGKKPTQGDGLNPNKLAENYKKQMMEGK